VQPGDVVHVRAGTYSEAQTCLECDDAAVLQVLTPGTADAWIRFVAEPGETVVFSPGTATRGILIRRDDSAPSYVEVSGFHVRGFTEGAGIYVARTTDVIVRRMEVTGCTDKGAIELHETARVTVESCVVHDNDMHGSTSAIDVWHCLDGNVVRGNLVYRNTDDPPAGSGLEDSEGHGIIMDLCQAAGGALIENNVIWDNEGWCITLYRSDGGTVRHNVCWQNGRRDPCGELAVYGNRHRIHNNVLLPQDGRFGITLRYGEGDYVVDPSTLEEDANLIWAPSTEQVWAWADGRPGDLATYQAENGFGWGTMSLQTDPQLVDPPNADFQPTATSPVVDSGDPEHAAAVDITMAPRPADGDGDGNAVVDIGAYELGAEPGGGGPGGAAGGPGTGAGGAGAAGATGGSGATGVAGGAASPGSAASTDESGGCGCRAGSSTRVAPLHSWAAALGAFALLGSRIARHPRCPRSSRRRTCGAR
jgi:parallel beta-helix repeat protein